VSEGARILVVDDEPAILRKLHVYVARLRKKLEDDPQQPRYLVNEPGIGYRLLVEER
jgi:DNA-binding winged helix-turn-helix (wHTH) protein